VKTKIKTALISVSDKTGLPAFARRLRALGVKILSTGGTARLLRENGIEVTDVSEYTGFPEILDGRVKTLHPKVHAGLLALRENERHLTQIRELGIETIDMVVVNLYPFEQTIAQPDVGLMEAIENIDIGGPSMIRSAAKNYTHVAVITSPEFYAEVADELERSDCTLSEHTLYRLGLAAFQHTAHYDAAIAGYLGGIGQEPGTHCDMLMLELRKKQELRYGENPHQRAAFYVERSTSEPCIAAARQVAGPELSFNNILDANAALELVKEFERPAAACIKHTNPCGAGTADSIHDAYRKAYLGDPVSAFGCIVALNRPFDTRVAQLVAELRAEIEGEPAPYFVEVIVAPTIEKDALDLLLGKSKWAERTRFLETGELKGKAADHRCRDMRRVVGGMLVQDRDLRGLDPAALKVATDLKPTREQMADLEFAWLCCKHVKSNAVVLAADGMLVGVGAGQMSRVDATAIAVRKAGERAAGSVLASDAFFPFPDSVAQAAGAGVKAIVQPGGSKGDEAVIAACNRLGVAMVLTGERHFRH